MSGCPDHKNVKRRPKPRRVGLAKRGLSMDPAAWGVNVAVSGYLIDAAAEMGWCSGNGLGASALTWTEIGAYAKATGQRFAPWEARTLRNMSAAFVEGYTTKNPLDPARWDRYAGALIPFIPIKDDPVVLRPELEASP